MMSVVKLGFLIDINMCYFLPDDQQIANEGWFWISKSKNGIYEILWLPQKLWLEIQRKHRFQIYDKNW